MTTGHREGSGDLRSAATRALAAAVAVLLQDEQADLCDLLPDDFAERMMEIAWSHQFDLEQVSFRRAMKAYLAEIAVLRPGGDLAR